jgi:hypothetical protein
MSSSVSITIKIKDPALDSEQIRQRATRYGERVAEQITGNGKRNGVKRRGDIDLLAYRMSGTRIVVEVHPGGTFEPITTSGGS